MAVSFRCGMGLFLDGQPFSLGWTSRMYRWHKGLRQSIFLIAGIYASDPSPRCGIPTVTQRVIPA
ncbi:hypothetical protein [Mesorhizobium sp.]|uniref:hypothetical protein n=1 Tax=Mesorhizobium sp. TaxID=1871066 RepID=UPI0025C0D382|nr:hypothetical protein [Mesorhizobium sp.]